MQATELAAGAPESTSSDSATFFLDLGLRSLAGGNVPAAQHRLESCRQHLEASIAQQPGDEQLRSRLGAVRGSQARQQSLPRCSSTFLHQSCAEQGYVQGDCCQRLGDLPAAAGHYEASVAVLEDCSALGTEVCLWTCMHTAIASALCSTVHWAQRCVSGGACTQPLQAALYQDWVLIRRASRRCLCP